MKTNERNAVQRKLPTLSHVFEKPVEHQFVELIISSDIDENCLRADEDPVLPHPPTEEELLMAEEVFLNFLEKKKLPESSDYNSPGVAGSRT